MLDFTDTGAKGQGARLKSRNAMRIVFLLQRHEQGGGKEVHLLKPPSHEALEGLNPKSEGAPETF